MRAVHTPQVGLDDTGASNGVDDSYRKMFTNGKDAWIELEEIPRGDDLYLKGVYVILNTGAAAGKRMLLDLSDWVERGIEPPRSTDYHYENGQILPAKTASMRFGVQPVAKLTANGQECLHIKCGEKVTLRCEAEVPEAAGSITFVDFDFEEHQEFPAVNVFATPGTFISSARNGVVYEAEHIYDKPGIYFASVRVKAERHGDKTNLFTQVKNLARARIIVNN